MLCYVCDGSRKYLVHIAFKFQFVTHAVTDMLHRTDIQCGTMACAWCKFQLSDKSLCIS